jgi:ATP-binding cassette subfamily C (CFTR/MRP) protein 1
MYVATSLGSTFTLFIGMLLVIRKSKIISTNSHSKTIDSLFEASLNKFFNRVPSGRVINRLSKDIGKIDQSLIDYMKLTLINLFLCLGNISMCIYASGFWGIIPMVPFVIGAFKIKTIYMKTKV